MCLAHDTLSQGYSVSLSSLLSLIILLRNNHLLQGARLLLFLFFFQIFKWLNNTIQKGFKKRREIRKLWSKNFKLGGCVYHNRKSQNKKTKTETTSGYFWREKEEEKSTRVEPLRQGSRAQRLSAEEAVKRCTLSLYPQARLPPHTVQLEPCYNPEGKKKNTPSKKQKKKVQWNVVYI
jgi:hypothetical protein